MKITLLRSGGLAPVLKKATLNVDWSEKELDELIRVMRVSDRPGKMRDNYQYELKYNDRSVTIDLQKVPGQYKQTFEKLFDSLQIVKRGEY